MIDIYKLIKFKTEMIIFIIKILNEVRYVTLKQGVTNQN